MYPREIRHDRRQQRGDRGFGNVGKSHAGTRAVDIAAQQLHADLKAPLIGPAPDDIEDFLVIARAGGERRKIGGETLAVGNGGGKSRGQHRVEQGRALRQVFRQSRRFRHDVGDQR